MILPPPTDIPGTRWGEYLLSALKRPLSVYMEESIKGLEEVYINAGKRGLLAAISPDEISRILNPRFVEVAV